MTSHHDVAGGVAELRDLAAEQTLKCWEPRHGDWMRALKKSADLLENQAKALSEAEAERDDCKTNMRLQENAYRTMKSRALAAEARLVEIEADRDGMTERMNRALGKADYEAERAGNIENECDELRARLAEINRIVHVPTSSGEKADHHFQRDFDAIRKLTAPFRAFTNAAKEKTDAQSE